MGKGQFIRGFSVDSEKWEYKSK